MVTQPGIEVAEDGVCCAWQLPLLAYYAQVRELNCCARQALQRHHRPQQ